MKNLSKNILQISQNRHQEMNGKKHQNMIKNELFLKLWTINNLKRKKIILYKVLATLPKMPKLTEHNHIFHHFILPSVTSVNIFVQCSFNKGYTI